MSKKHFESAAARIKVLLQNASDAADRGDFEARNRMVAEANGAQAIIISLGCDLNPRFDSARFIAACRPIERLVKVG